MFIWVALKENVKSARILWIITEVCLNLGFLLVLWKSYQKLELQGNLRQTLSLHGSMTWKVMQRNAWKDIANVRIKQVSNNTKSQRLFMDDHQLKDEENGSVGELATVCTHIVLKSLYLVRTGRPDIFPWSVNKLARAMTKWTKACNERLPRLISYIHHTCEYRQYFYVGNITQQCRVGLFQYSVFAGDPEDSKSTSGGRLCIFGSHTFLPISWMCKKQTSVSHSSTEAEVFSLDAGLRMDGTPALDLRYLVVEVLHSSPTQSKKTQRSSTRKLVA